MDAQGALAQHLRALFEQKENFKVITITSKHGTTIFFSYYNLYLRKLKEKLTRTARVNTDASISDRADAPLGIPQYSSNPINSIWPPYR